MGASSGYNRNAGTALYVSQEFGRNSALHPNFHFILQNMPVLDLQF
jgi:hypothetical protein